MYNSFCGFIYSFLVFFSLKLSYFFPTWSSHQASSIHLTMNNSLVNILVRYVKFIWFLMTTISWVNKCFIILARMTATTKIKRAAIKLLNRKKKLPQKRRRHLKRWQSHAVVTSSTFIIPFAAFWICISLLVFWLFNHHKNSCFLKNIKIFVVR